MKIYRASLGELVKVQTGKLDANASSPDGAYPFFTCAREPLRIGSWSYDLDAILVAGNGDLNVKHYNGKFEAYQRTYILSVSDLSLLDARYLFHFMDKYVEVLRNKSIGGVIKYIKLGMLTEAQIPLPPLDEQKRIAAILDKADQLRQKRRQAIALLDSLTQSIFIEMFGDPVSNPKGWELDRLEDIVAAVVDCPHSTPSWVSSGKIALRTSNLTKGRWNWSDTRYVSDVEFSERSRRRSVRPGDIVLSREGTVGVAAIVESDMEVCLGQRLVQIAVDERKSVSAYLLHHLLFDLDPERIAHVMVGATSQHINVKDLRNLKIMMPPISQQLEFERRRNRLQFQLMNAIASNRDMDSLFASLQYRAFSGQL